MVLMPRVYMERLHEYLERKKDFDDEDTLGLHILKILKKTQLIVSLVIAQNSMEFFEFLLLAVRDALVSDGIAIDTDILKELNLYRLINLLYA